MSLTSSGRLRLKRLNHDLRERLIIIILFLSDSAPNVDGKGSFDLRPPLAALMSNYSTDPTTLAVNITRGVAMMIKTRRRDAKSDRPARPQARTSLKLSQTVSCAKKNYLLSKKN